MKVINESSNFVQMTEKSNLKLDACNSKVSYIINYKSNEDFKPKTK